MLSSLKKTVLLLLLFAVLTSGVSAFDLSWLQLGVNLDDQIYVESVKDDDGSIEFTELFIVRVGGVVERYAYEDVVPGQVLFELVPDAEGAYYNFMDRDGSMQNIGIFITITGKKKPCIDCPISIPAFKSVSAIPRMNDDYTGYIYDLEAVSREDFPIDAAYAHPKHRFPLNAAKSEDFVELENSEANPTLWTGNYGPRTDELYFQYYFEPEGEIESPYRFHGANYLLQWVFFKDCSPEATLKSVPAEESTVASEDEKVAQFILKGYSDMEMTLNESGDVRVSWVDDDDGSIQLVSIHVIVGGVDTPYYMKDAKRGDTLIGIVPPDAIAYYNFTDFDGSRFNMQLLRPFKNIVGGGGVPSANIFKSVSFDPILSSDELTYTLRGRVEIYEGYAPNKIDLSYKLVGNEYNLAVTMVEESPRVYVASLGPFEDYVGVTVAFIPEAPNPEELRYRNYYLGRRDYYQFKTPACDNLIPLDPPIKCDNEDPALNDPECGFPLYEICDDDIDNDGDGLIDEGECIEPKDIKPEPPDWVLKIESERLLVGEIQRIWVEDAETGDKIPNVEVAIQHAQSAVQPILLSTGESGLIEYRVKAEGYYEVFAAKDDFESAGEFRSMVSVTTAIESITNVAGLLFGSGAVENPLLLILLIIMCVIAGLLVYDRSQLVFKTKVKSTSQKRKEKVIRILFAVAAFGLPLALTKLTFIYAGIGLAAVEIAGVFIGSYMVQRAKEKKPITV